jgi:glucose/mannose transport system permease protein
MYAADSGCFCYSVSDIQQEGVTPVKPNIFRINAYLLLILFAGFFLMPLYVIVSISLKPFSDISPATMWSPPFPADFSNYRAAFEKLLPNVINSFKMVIPATLISAFMGSLHGYVFAKWKFKGSNILFWLIVMGMFLPFQSILLPMVNILQRLYLYNTIPGLVLVHVIYGMPITTLIFRNAYVNIPQAMIEAAQIDGSGFWGIYSRIILPLSLSGFVVVFIWQFTNIWNEFLFAIIVTGAGKQPVMVALQNMAGSQVVQWNITMAGSVVAALPTLLVYLVAGKYFIQGMLAGSVKG